MFFAVSTKNLNWKILTKNLGTLKDGMRLRIKYFSIMSFTENVNFSGGGGFPKKQYIGWTVCRFKGRLGRKGGVVFLRGVDTLMHTSSCSNICNSVLAL